MRILWVSNSPWSPSGYGVQTKLFVSRLQQALHHQMAVLCNFGLDGGKIDWGKIPLYPKRFEPYANNMIRPVMQHHRADVALVLYDSWVLQPDQFEGMPWCPWFPVDHDPLPPPVARVVSRSTLPLVYSRFAEEKLLERGIECRYVPHGVDTSVYEPQDQAECRQSLNWPQDRYIIGMVAANHGGSGCQSRKAFAEHLLAFDHFHRRHPDSLLYLHTHATQEAGGMNIPELVESLGLQDVVLYPEPFAYALGYSEETMVRIYNSLDVLASVSMGEGFGVPILEAQSCGVPVITGDWTSMGELTWGGYKVPRSEAFPFYTPLASYQFLPRWEAILEGMEWAYARRGEQALSDRAREGAQEYDADLITSRYWRPVLQEIAQRVGVENHESRVESHESRVTSREEARVS